MKTTWWKVGLMGAATLALATIVKMVVAIPAIVGGKTSLTEACYFVGVVFGIGFACGVCVWLVLPLARKGTIGLAVTGFVVMNFFFLCCMLVFDPSLLSPRPKRALPMFIFAPILGPFAGVVIGRGVQRGIAEAKAELEEEGRDVDRRE
jgi:hypothetical protein